MKKKILIVDDEPNIVMTLEYALKKRDYEVFIARDGSEALEVMKQNIPDVILLDIMMSNIDGYKPLKLIKENEAYKNVKIIFLTDKDRASDIQRGLEYGVVKYLTKPFALKKIVAEIRELFDE